MNSTQIRHLTEAYQEIYSENSPIFIHEEIELLSDEQLDIVVEGAVAELLEEGYTLEDIKEAFEDFDESLITEVREAKRRRGGKSYEEIKAEIDSREASKKQSKTQKLQKSSSSRVKKSVSKVTGNVSASGKYKPRATDRPNTPIASLSPKKKGIKINNIRKRVSGAISKAGDKFNKAAEKTGKSFASAGKRASGTVKKVQSTASGTVKKAGNAANSAASKAGDKFNKAAEKTGKSFASAGKRASGTVKKVQSTASGTVKKAGNAANSAASKAGDKFSKAAEKTGKSFASAGKRVQSTASSTVKKAGDAANSAARSAARGTDRAEKAVAGKAKQAKSGLKGMIRRAATSVANRASSLAKRMSEEYDQYDLVLEFLVDNEIAENLQEAQWMMVNEVDSEDIATILEAYELEEGKSDRPNGYMHQFARGVKQKRGEKREEKYGMDSEGNRVGKYVKGGSRSIYK